MNAFCGSVFYSLAFCSGNYLSVFELSAGKKADDGILKGLCSYAATLSSHPYGLNLGITIEVWTFLRKRTEW